MKLIKQIEPQDIPNLPFIFLLKKSRMAVVIRKTFGSDPETLKGYFQIDDEDGWGYFIPYWHQVVGAVLTVPYYYNPSFMEVVAMDGAQVAIDLRVVWEILSPVRFLIQVQGKDPQKDIINDALLFGSNVVTSSWTSEQLIKMPKNDSVALRKAIYNEALRQAREKNKEEAREKSRQGDGKATIIEEPSDAQIAAKIEEIKKPDNESDNESREVKEIKAGLSGLTLRRLECDCEKVVREEVEGGFRDQDGNCFRWIVGRDGKKREFLGQDYADDERLLLNKDANLEDLSFGVGIRWVRIENMFSPEVTEAATKERTSEINVRTSRNQAAAARVLREAVEGMTWEESLAMFASKGSIKDVPKPKIGLE